jgi:uncharacterized membrane protein
MDLLGGPMLAILSDLESGEGQMKVGLWFYAAGTILTGMLAIAWQAFDPMHQPIQSLGAFSGQSLLACFAGVWLVAAGLALVWPRSEKLGAAACAIAYALFASLWLFRYYAGVHTLGWRIDVLLGVSFGLGQQLMLLAPAAILYVSMTSTGFSRQASTVSVARWMLGVPPVIFGLLHLAGLPFFASIVPHWMGFGRFWAATTGIAFILAGVAICAKRKDILAAKLLALMLLLFEGLVEIPPIFIRLHDLKTWGAAVYNVTAIGACLIFAEVLVRRANQQPIESPGTVPLTSADRVAV